MNLCTHFPWNMPNPIIILHTDMSSVVTNRFLKPKFSVGGICPDWCYSLMHLVDTGKNVKGLYMQVVYRAL